MLAGQFSENQYLMLRSTLIKRKVEFAAYYAKFILEVKYFILILCQPGLIEITGLL